VRRERFVIALVMLCATLAPTRAFAWGIEWLDMLSGPGPFVGFKIDARALCWLGGGGPGAADGVVTMADPACLRDGRRENAVNVADELRAYLSIEAAWSSSAKNEMFQALRFDPRTEVDLVAVRPAVIFRAFSWVDAGLAVGINRFSGPVLTESFTWVSVQPRVVFTPFANSRSRVARAMEFRTDVVFIPEKVRDEFIERVRRDLPEQPNSFEGGELRLMFGIEVDVFRLF
jgi:hypothetical protein